MMEVQYQHVEKAEIIKDLIHVPFYNNDVEHYFTETLCVEYRVVDPIERVIVIDSCERPIGSAQYAADWVFDIREAIESQTGMSIFGEMHFVEKIS